MTRDRSGGYPSSDRTPTRLPKVEPGPAPGSKPKAPFEEGDHVDIIAGPYEGLSGTIDHTHAADYPNQCVTVTSGTKLHIYNQNLRRSS